MFIVMASNESVNKILSYNSHFIDGKNVSGREVRSWSVEITNDKG